MYEVFYVCLTACVSIFIVYVVCYVFEIKSSVAENWCDINHRGREILRKPNYVWLLRIVSVLLMAVVSKGPKDH